MPAKTASKKEINEKLIPEVNIGIVGHVDHGKTTLTRAITGKWADTHSEEQKRGITIKLGYADATVYKCGECDEPQCYMLSEKCLDHGDNEIQRTISMIDAPGHETLMATVLTGANLMDGAILMVSANEEVPQPQTLEHLMALDISEVKNIIIVQNKIDLVDKEEALENYKQIKKFVKGTVAENAPIVPVSAEVGINIDLLLKTIEETIKTPERDPSLDPKMYSARSFDVNKPGTKIKKLRGGIIGGSLVQGKFEVGDEIEIRPGVRKEVENQIVWEPLNTKIVGLEKARMYLEEAGPGGLLGLMTELDPSLVKGDGMAGTVIGHPGKLPEMKHNLEMEVHFIDRVVDKVERQEIKSNDLIMINAGTSKTAGAVKSARRDGENFIVELPIKIPLCIEEGQKVAISRQIKGRWRLVGWGLIK